MIFHRVFHQLIRHLYYSRITVTGRENIPREGPLLVICLHRNGAVDGFVYLSAVPTMQYLVRAKLRKGLMGHLFFPGIDVVRGADGGTREGIMAMIDDCAKRLELGTILGIFPEGTSDLGPRHLPFSSGAARIAAKCLDRGVPLKVMPVGIHYENPWAFRSRVEVVVGEPVPLESLVDDDREKSRIGKIRVLFRTALEEVGINVRDERMQDVLARFAYAATLGTDTGYFEAMKAMERKLPAEAERSWERLEKAIRDKRVLLHQGIPLFPASPPLYVAWTVLMGVPVLTGMLLNAVPIIAAWYAGRRFADARNVIALWRILVGVPLFMIWAAGCMVAAFAVGPWLAGAYIVLTTAAICGWYRLKKLAVASWNGLCHPELRQEAWDLQKLIHEHLGRQEA